MTRRITLTTPASIARAKQIRRLLKLRPRTAHDLSLSMGITKTSINNYLVALRDQAHIIDWTHEGGPEQARTYPRAIWAWGAGEDMPRPARKTSLQYMREYHARAKQHPERYPLVNKRRLLRALRGRPRSSPLQALVSATLHANQ